MSQTGPLRYVLSCGVLTLPILVWTAVFTPLLPPALASNEFSRDIPPLVAYSENTLRVVVMVLPFLMPLEGATLGQRRGVMLFMVGVILYFLAWAPLLLTRPSTSAFAARRVNKTLEMAVLRRRVR